jgi:hypothetical protein
MLNWWDVDRLDVERLLSDWRWLCPQKLTLVSRNAFGDMFLCDEDGRVFRLDVSGGEFAKVADSRDEFIELARTKERREEWFAESDERRSAAQGIAPDSSQCIGFSIPLVFSESGNPGNAYVSDIYDCTGALGDLHRQIKELPDGAKVELKVKR